MSSKIITEQPLLDSTFCASCRLPHATNGGRSVSRFMHWQHGAELWSIRRRGQHWCRLAERLGPSASLLRLWVQCSSPQNSAGQQRRLQSALRSRGSGVSQPNCWNSVSHEANQTCVAVVLHLLTKLMNIGQLSHACLSNHLCRHAKRTYQIYFVWLQPGSTGWSGWKRSGAWAVCWRAAWLGAAARSSASASLGGA